VIVFGINVLITCSLITAASEVVH